MLACVGVSVGIGVGVIGNTFVGGRGGCVDPGGRRQPLWTMKGSEWPREGRYHPGMPKKTEERRRGGHRVLHRMKQDRHRREEGLMDGLNERMCVMGDARTLFEPSIYDCSRCGFGSSIIIRTAKPSCIVSHTRARAHLANCYQITFQYFEFKKEKKLLG